ncbi:Fibrinogen-like protein A,Ryncolin-4,Ficolin-3,Ficolin-2,Ryncolin-1,Tenascin-R,Fibrinogen-like protein 1,Angiopoietin-1,Tenascin-X,Fibrinogen C domain-containing protein 1-A,Ficolin-1,Veficolin-1,Ryncolin-3,Fibrinogen C domain-containing protein 1,Ryncolin-2,Angiopoietin-related protein 2,Microfibril-associated glycoprotein 4,Tenascin,Fibrinogen C domain-containing protein 1-B [Mytilus coruscus]|uniref:Fibrinogen C-terminal domain-containing protein n=1 Tax=Mytilus coruscus TaxID=42192 RepID=A0A6J8BX61_MYTCO|nr:Fibrinogen-like protein A,Ryncolin-4,Ficolin-3,Ficolin-2,Ryncolin-1,Tenascin-R,Fibrinogen-like protein 1,Angiopoietin-1,Tenascin-X,Fibrinogen C domain-containing protein 1-A,Ficolin-1,Veficolin-1,Ryncolin-3,Fibrinogen C domain-containing protein 1,Ryncolin-2,Angiopoietin-related protein 2,Microfibril-associated glycoprotein 4,Tenascin,Fibrinogen C domain-containing protein 1-B [Mytilus coruscus]
MQLFNQEEIMMFKILIYGLTLLVLASTATSNSNEDVQVRLLDNQNAPLVATLDMSKANERVKQFVSDAIEAKMKNIEETVKSKQFVSDALEAKLKNIEETVKSKQFVSDALETKMKNIEETMKSKLLISDALEAKMKDLEVNLKSQIANFERNLTDQLTDYINEMVGNIVEENVPEKTEEPNQRPIDCKDVKLHKGNGIYKIYPKNLEPGFEVYCDFETDNGGWTVFQRRLNGKTDFYRGWETYKNGFGDLEAEFWLGNQNIHTITKQGTYELRVDISDFNGNKAFARYATFSVGDASTNYKLTIAGYSGNAGELYLLQKKSNCKINLKMNYLEPP